MDTMNVVIREDGTREETHRTERGDRVSVKTTTTKPCGCETTLSYDIEHHTNGVTARGFGGSGHSSKTCDMHRITSWNDSVRAPGGLVPASARVLYLI